MIVLLSWYLDIRHEDPREVLGKINLGGSVTQGFNLPILQLSFLGSNPDITTSSCVRESKISQGFVPRFSLLIKRDNRCEAISMRHMTDTPNVTIIIIVITKLYVTECQELTKFRPEATSKTRTEASAGAPRLTYALEAVLQFTGPWAAVSAPQIPIITLFSRAPGRYRYTCLYTYAHKMTFLFSDHHFQFFKFLMIY